MKYATRGFSIRRKLLLASFALLVLLAAMAAVGAWRLAELDGAATRMATINLRMERLAGEWLAATRSNVVRATVLTYSDDAELRRILGPEMEATSQRINALQGEVEKLLADPDARELFARVSDKRRSYLAARQGVLEKRRAGAAAEAVAMMDSAMLPAARSYVDSIQALSAHYTAQVGRDAAAASASAASGRNVLVGFGLLGMLLGAAFCAWLLRSITRPIAEAVRTARQVADGDLTVRIRTGDGDEMGQLLQALADMAQRLRELVGQVASGAHGVADTCEQIAQGNHDLSQRTEEQASTLEETASSMEELTSTVSQNAEAARKASEVAAGASDVARQGGRAVAQVVSTMGGIAESSRRIGDIIGVIDGIAFQTNILALNAAVEAARAGEQGRGFSVVAGEVRQLAQRSAEAAKEIKALIGASVSQVEDGSRQVSAAGKTMEEIVRSVKQVTDLIAEIAAASQEQSQGIEQVNTAVAQMEQVVQQNASLAEEASAATESMKQQSSALLQLVARFKLSDAPLQAAPSAPTARAQAPRSQLAPTAPRMALAGQPGWREF